MDQGLVKELTRRTQLAQVIDSMIAAHIEPRKTCHVRLPRGVVHDLAAKYLGLKVSNFVRAFVNSRMIAAGYPLMIQRGNFYYRHAKLRGQDG